MRAAVARSFARGVGMGSARLVEAARLARAKALFESSDWTVERIAERSGFGSSDGLQRAFQKQLGIIPTDYRSRFRINTQWA